MLSTLAVRMGGRLMRLCGGPARAMGTLRQTAVSQTGDALIRASPMVYISGEEMTHYTMGLILEEWIKPHVDISEWQFFSLDCKTRDATDDQVLRDAVAAGTKLLAIFKEPTITPTAEQQKQLGLKKSLPSPNGLMRKVGAVSPSCACLPICIGACAELITCVAEDGCRC
jgi:hypothetical protein